MSGTISSWVPVVCSGCRAPKMTYEQIVEDGLRLTTWFCPGCGVVFESRLEERKALVVQMHGEEILIGDYWAEVDHDEVDGLVDWACG